MDLTTVDRAVLIAIIAELLIWFSKPGGPSDGPGRSCPTRHGFAVGARLENCPDCECTREVIELFSRASPEHCSDCPAPKVGGVVLGHSASASNRH